MSARGYERRFTTLLIALLLLLLVGPALQQVRGGSLINIFAGVLIPLAGLYAVTDGGRALAIGLGLALPGIAANLWWLLQGPDGVALFAALPPLIFFAYVAITIGRHVFRLDRVTADTLSGAACVYLLAGFVWWFGYIVVTLLAPTSFAGVSALDVGGRLDLLYFSFVTLTTLGYGDVTPLGPHARSLAMVEAVFGVLFLAILIARLVGLYRAAEASNPPARPDGTGEGSRPSRSRRGPS